MLVLIWVAEVIGVTRESKCGAVPLAHSEQQILHSAASRPVRFEKNDRRCVRPGPEHVKKMFCGTGALFLLHWHLHVVQT